MFIFLKSGPPSSSSSSSSSYGESFSSELLSTTIVSDSAILQYCLISDYAYFSSMYFESIYKTLVVGLEDILFVIP